jgi:uncharacterized protein (DUF433 family)
MLISQYEWVFDHTIIGLLTHGAKYYMKTDLIHSDPAVMMGKPVIKGTRITVEMILEKLAAGETTEQILSAHPRLRPEAIQAALAFAAEILHADVVYPHSDSAA